MMFIQGDTDGGRAAAMVLGIVRDHPSEQVSVSPGEPLLVLEGGSELRSGSAILNFFADQVSWLREDEAGDYYRAAEWLNFVLTEIDFSERPLADERLNDRARDRLEQSQQRKWDILAERLSSQDFLLGDRLSIADFYLAACILAPRPWLRSKGLFDPYLERFSLCLRDRMRRPLAGSGFDPIGRSS